MDNSSQETLLVDGKPVAVDRNDYQSLIEQTAREDNCTVEEAWDRVKDHVIAVLTQKSERGRRGRSQARPAQDLFDTGRTEPVQKSDASDPKYAGNSLSGAPEIIAGSRGRYLLRLNGAPISAVRLEALPEQLLRTRKSVLEMVSLGIIDLEGEHEDVALLRLATPAGVFDTGPVTDPARQEAISAIIRKQMQYPLQRQTVRILPSDFSKTSLFHVASNNTPRRFCENEVLGKVGDSTQIEYRGEELRHDDELVFMQLLHVARGKRPYEWLHFNVAHFFRGSRGTRRILSAKDTKSVADSLLRLRHALLIVRNTNTGKFITVNLIKDLLGDPTQQQALIDPAVVLLCSSFAAMNTEHLFSTSGVARQILKYLSTIPNGIDRLHPIKVTSLFELCYGTIDSLHEHYRTQNPDKPEAKVRIAISKKVSDFRRTTLPAALQALQDSRVITDFRLDQGTDKVTLVRNPDATSASVEGIQPDESA
ncbi:plasmid replication initiator TrfA [Burkholderia vietnamiensis]|uniref:plasmid replication initiator TrfA n=1 Tax=Burkholderia vietnamiensis TaxID=60552 RepID=UPI001CF1CA7D|nr:plasmid replication initiator TrfA [Burkholderia vietnamiensis]MCA8228164.1 hypothetical protein [Burkholderia vietnamiensis]